MSAPNYSPTGFWRIIAQGHLDQHLKKPFFKKPHMVYAHCINLWTSAFEIGGIIGTKYAMSADPLMSYFIGMSGPAGSAQKALSNMIEAMPNSSVLASMMIYEYIIKGVAKSLGQECEGWSDFMMSHKDTAFTEEVILTFTWNFASSGLALGVCHPDIFRRMFDLTYSPVSKEEWSFAHAAGLAIPSEQPDHSYSTVEKLWNMIFLEFAKKYDQSQYSLLVG